MTTITIMRGDTKQKFTAKLVFSNGTAMNLAGAVVSFILRPFDSDVGNKRNAVIVTAATGDVEYQPVANDVAVAGRYWQQWEAVFSDGLVATFPNGGFNVVEILQDLG